MSDPFVMALDVLFYAPGSAAAMFTPIDGAPRTIRVIRTVRAADAPFGGTPIQMDAAVFEIRRSEVAEPLEGDTLQVGAEAFKIVGDPDLDVEGLTWRCEAPPVA